MNSKHEEIERNFAADRVGRTFHLLLGIPFILLISTIYLWQEWDNILYAQVSGLLFLTFLSIWIFGQKAPYRAFLISLILYALLTIPLFVWKPSILADTGFFFIAPYIYLPLGMKSFKDLEYFDQPQEEVKVEKVLPAVLKSRFTIFFVLTRTLLLLVPIAFCLIPPFILFNNDIDFEGQPKLAPALIAAAIVYPFAYLMFRNYNVVRLKFDRTGFSIRNFLGGNEKKYAYSEIVKIDFSTHEMEGYQPTGGRLRIPDVNYVSFVAIYLKDESFIELSSDVYSNYQEIIDYIEAHKDVIQIID